MIDIKEISAYIYGEKIGTLIEDDDKIYFSYSIKFKTKGLELSPLKLPVSLTKPLYINNDDDVYKGMAGIFYDSIPDKHGLALMDRFFESEGKSVEEISMLYRLMFIGDRGMGAIEYRPSRDTATHEQQEIKNIKLAYSDMRDIEEGKKAASAEDLYTLIDSASPVGGAKPKMLVQYNKSTKSVMYNNRILEDGYERYLLKFDYIQDSTKESPSETKYEYIYMNMARDCGIEVPELFLLEEGGLSHYMIKRFDRTNADEKIHIATASALAHKNIKISRVMSYEELFLLTMRVTQSQEEIVQLFRRMVFNILSVNNDTHPKNFAFMMNSKGKWKLSPSYDIIYSKAIGILNPLMTINGKIKGYKIKDFLDIAKSFLINKKKALIIIDDIKKVLNTFNQRADDIKLNNKKKDGCWMNIKEQLEEIFI